MTDQPKWPCRFCGAPAEAWGRNRVLRKYDVSYFRCTGCLSLQSEPPYWLKESYASAGTGVDTGACQRSLNLAMETAALLSLMRWPLEAVALDHGAGMGTFARMMRDRGFNFLAYDLHHIPFYMDRYCIDDPSKLRPALITAHEVMEHLEQPLITAHEVMEHLEQPADDLKALFGQGADLVMVTTECFHGQGTDWWYLAPDHGQHIFFYSDEALMMIAERFGYSYATTPRMHVYWRSELEGKLATRGGNVIDALAVANDPSRFGRVVFEEFVKHQAEPFRYAMRDMQEINRCESV